MSAAVNSLVIPVYRNAATIDALVAAIEGIAEQLDGELEAVFVVDGSPDDSRERLLARAAAARRSRSRVVVDHSRNFGSFAAIRTGMQLARGELHRGDGRRPPGAARAGRRVLPAPRDAARSTSSPASARAATTAATAASKVVLAALPPLRHGRDAARRRRRLRLHRRRCATCSARSREVNTSLVAQLFWVGFRRELVPYDRRAARRARAAGRCAASSRYLSDSVFAFTDLPIRILWCVGVARARARRRCSSRWSS